MSNEIKYYKEKSSGKKRPIMSGGGPRDRQRKQQLADQEKLIQSHDKSQSLPLTEVKRKIDEAVAFTREEEQNKNQSLIENLKQQVRDLHKEIQEKESEIVRLQTKLEMSGGADSSVEDLKEKIGQIYEKILDGTISEVVTQDAKGRPVIDDKVFIDPIDKDKESDYDPHINIDKDKSDNKKRNMKSDLDKLRKVLKK